MIFLDTNEASKQSKDGTRVMDDALDYLSSEVPVETIPLKSGDCMFYGYGDDTREYTKRIGLEFKVTPSDLLSSLSDGRLIRQLPDMIQTYHLPYLVLVHNPVTVNFATGKVEQRRGRAREDSSWSWVYLNSILAKFEAAGGCVRYVQDIEHLCATVLALYQYHRKRGHQTHTWSRKYQPIRDWAQLSNPVAEIYERAVDDDGRGIGIQRALVLAEKYPRPTDLRGVSWRTIADLKLTNGKRFGPVNSKKVAAWFG